LTSSQPERRGGDISRAAATPYCEQLGYNTRRLLEPLGYVSPDEFEQAYYNRQAVSAEVAVLT
jgi:hypothetical protein